MAFAWKASGLTYVPLTPLPFPRSPQLASGLTGSSTKQLQQIPLGRRTRRPPKLEG